MTHITYPTKIFYLKEIAPRAYSLEDTQKSEPPVILIDSNNTHTMKVDKCTVESFDDVLNMKTLPGFIRYLPEEIDRFIEESIAK